MGTINTNKKKKQKKKKNKRSIQVITIGKQLKIKKKGKIGWKKKGGNWNKLN